MRVQGYRRPPVDATTTPVLSDVVPACVLRARTPGAPPATFCPPGPKQNTSSDRANLWTNHRICSTPRASTMPWRILLPKWAIARARGKLEARLCAVVRGGGTICLETKVLLPRFIILCGKVGAPGLFGVHRLQARLELVPRAEAQLTAPLRRSRRHQWIIWRYYILSEQVL